MQLKYLFFFIFISYLCGGRSFGHSNSNIRPISLKILNEFGIVKGRVLNDAKKPIEYAVISLKSINTDSTIGGTVSQSSGLFIIEKVPFGKFRIEIRFLGFEKWISEPIIISPNNVQSNIGDVVLKLSIQDLKEVNVVSQKEALVNGIDKKIFNVDKSIVSAGGTANDVLRQVPSVNVDIDGKISLRGNDNITVLIDGRPNSQLGDGRRAVLNNIPSNLIEQIEIITNPGAKYSAEGMGGIINIVTKKNKVHGFSGLISANAGTRSRLGTLLSLNYMTKNINLYSNFSLRNEIKYSYGYSYRKNIFADTSYYINQNSFQLSNEKNATGKVGADIKLNSKTNLGLSVGLNTGIESKPDNIYYQLLDESNTLSKKYSRASVSSQKMTGADFNMNARRILNKPKEEVSVDITYSLMNRNSYQNFIEHNTFLSLIDTLNTLPVIEYQILNGRVNTLNAQIDYTYPVSSTQKLELGAKSTNRIIDAENQFYKFSNLTGFLYDSTISNHFKFDEQINAAYLSYGTLLRTSLIQMGIRAEYTKQLITLLNNDYFTKNSYFNFFPSIAVKQPLRENQFLQLSYTKRINRPGFHSQSPFVDISDPQNKRKGNPLLKPELIDAYELSYLKSWRQNNLTATLYWRHSKDLIVRYRTILADGSSLISMTNAYSSDNIGVEVIAKNQISRYLDMMNSFNFFKSKINAKNIDSDLQNDNFSWTFRSNLNIKLNNGLFWQINTNYEAPRVLPQGETVGVLILSSGIRKDLLKNRLSLTLNMNDIFDQMRMEMNTQDLNFEQSMLRKMPSRFAMFTASYKFGKIGNEPSKRARGNRSQGSADTMPDDF
jgi:iron complex outermembrane receptor protein